MNWVWPNAPAQEPASFSAGMSPLSMIFKVAVSSERK